MSRKEFAAWKKNGNFTISQNRILTVTNHITEGEHDAYNKDEAAQCATYWSLDAATLGSRLYAMRSNVKVAKLLKQLDKRLGEKKQGCGVL